MYKFELQHYMLYLWGEKVYICGLAKVLSPQITKRLSPQIENQQSVRFVEGQQI
jgi:hypothetical protein